MAFTNIPIPDLGKRLRAARHARRFSQKELAWLTGLAPDQIAAYEHDRHTPSLAMFARLCTALETSADVLLGLAVSTSKETPDA